LDRVSRTIFRPHVFGQQCLVKLRKRAGLDRGHHRPLEQLLQIVIAVFHSPTERPLESSPPPSHPECCSRPTFFCRSFLLGTASGQILRPHLRACWKGSHDIGSFQRLCCSSNVSRASRPGRASTSRLAAHFERELFAALQDVVSKSPFRHMTTPGGYRMSVAMTNCGSAAWVTDRSGYRYNPSAGRPCQPYFLILPAARRPQHASLAFHPMLP
jgi:hypothetical protein